ncbi:MAG TPA: saccharopine dehydrogenase NADP-binding domain-containing protein, partial [Terriglobales bacterium]|nr:saccharopine dehydrogenase NADP-binding domain-containing protein [Terriglobales bacterium]
MSFSYIVLGGGRQGMAAAYDLAKFGDADRVTLADVNAALAKESAQKVNQLLGHNAAEALTLDVRDKAAVRQAVKNYDVVLSAVPYFFNLDLTRLAIESGVSFCDLGGNTDIVLEQHSLHDDACRAGVRVVPDCGMGPGMGNTLAVYAMSLLDHAEHVYICDGGLPQHPTPPWNYQLTFNIEGLTNEYYGGMTVLRGGKLTHIPCFTELEMVEVPPLGELERFFIAG